MTSQSRSSDLCHVQEETVINEKGQEKRGGEKWVGGKREDREE